MKTLRFVLAIVVWILVAVVVITSARAVMTLDELAVQEGYTTWAEIAAKRGIPVYLLPHETYTSTYISSFNWLDWLQYLYPPVPPAPAPQILIAPNAQGKYPYPYQFPVGDLNAPLWYYMDRGQWQDRQEEIFRKKGAFDFPTKGQQFRTVPSKGALIKYGTNRDIDLLKMYE